MAEINKEAVMTVVNRLATHFPPNVVLMPGTERYQEAVGKVWNRDNADIQPQAIVTPQTAQELGEIVRILSETNTPFAIRSGGYMPVPGYNTSPSILLCTANLDKIDLLPGDLVRFGAGLQWGQVYDFLEPHGLVVPGGRSRPVGVSGFLLHGGVSHFYNKIGWGCEAVVEFEVVLPDANVVVANSKENTDLYWALKGGGKNFGVVSAFTMQCQHLPKMWGGSRIALGTTDTASAVFKAMHKFLDEDDDEKSHVEIISFFNPHMCASGDPMFALSLAYAADEERPEALKGFLDVAAVADMTRVTSQRDLADDDKSFVGYDKRGLFRAFSYRGGSEITLELYKEFYALVKQHGVFEEDPTAVAALLWLPATRRLASGEGVVSLGEEATPYFSTNVVMRWEKPEVSQKMHSFADMVVKKLTDRLKESGAHVPFTYANIAGVEDTTFAGLPEKTRQRLREVSTKYDPQGVFQKQVSGFKLE